MLGSSMREEGPIKQSSERIFECQFNINKFRTRLHFAMHGIRDIGNDVTNKLEGGCYILYIVRYRGCVTQPIIS